MTTWVLLRGLTREARHWGTLPKRLALELGGTLVLTPDLPGNGVRHRERSAMTVAGHAAACRDALRDAGHAPPYVLLGLSLGGMVAMAWASRHPDDVRGLVLLNVSARGIGSWHSRLRLHTWGSLAYIAFGTKADERERLVLALTSRHAPAETPDLIADWSRWREERPVSVANALRQLMAAARFSVPARPAAPALVLASEGDALVDPRCSHALAAAWNAPLKLHATAGHDLPLDDPAWVAKNAAGWWRSVSG